MGLLELDQKNYKTATRAFDRAIEINPDFAIAYYNRAIAYRYNGNSKKAIDDLNKSLDINQNRKNIYFKKALIKKEIGDLLDYKRAYIKETSFTDAPYNRVFTYKFMGDYSNAIRNAELIVKEQPNTKEHWNLKGNVHSLL